MNHSNTDYIDILPKKPRLQGLHSLWKACWPIDIIKQGADLETFVPFQKQDLISEDTPVIYTPRKYYKMKIRAYGDRMLRISICFDDESLKELLNRDEQVLHQTKPLYYRKFKDQWVIKDATGIVRTVFHFKNANKNFYNDLLPPKNDSIQISFYPDGKNEFRLGFSENISLEVEKNELYFTEINEAIELASISLSKQQDALKNSVWWQIGEMNLNQHLQNLYMVGDNLGLFLYPKEITSNFVKLKTDSLNFISRMKILDLFIIGGQNKYEILEEFERFVSLT